MEPHEPRPLLYGLGSVCRPLRMKDLQQGEGERCPEQDDPAQHQALHATPPFAYTGEAILSTSKHDGICPHPAHLPKVYSPECVEGKFSEVREAGVLGSSSPALADLLH